MRSLLAPALVVALTALATSRVAAAADPNPDDRTVVVDERVTVRVPAGYTYDLLELGAKGRVVTLTDGQAVLLLTVYDGDKPPQRGVALEVHAAELRERTDGAPPTKRRAAFLGARRPAREIRYVAAGAPHTARIVAARRARKTLVAVWSWPSADAARRAALEALLDSVTLR